MKARWIVVVATGLAAVACSRPDPVEPPGALNPAPPPGVGPEAPVSQPMVVPQGLPRRPEAVSLSPDGHLALLTGDTGAHLVDTRTGVVRGVVARCARGGVILDDGARAAILSCDARSVFIWSLADGAISTVRLSREATGLADVTSADVAVACHSRGLTLVDARRGRAVDLDGLGEPDSVSPCSFARLAFAPDGHSVALTGEEVHVFSAATGRTTAKVPGRRFGRAVSWSPSSDAFAVGLDHGVVIHDAATKLPRTTLDVCAPSFVSDVAFTPQGDRLAVGCVALGNPIGTVELVGLDGKRGTPIRVPVGSPALTFGERGDKLLLADLLGVALVEVASGEITFHAPTGCAVHQRTGCLQDDDVCATRASRDLGRLLVSTWPLDEAPYHSLLETGESGAPSRKISGSSDGVSVYSFGPAIKVIRRDGPSLTWDPIRDEVLPDADHVRGGELILAAEGSRAAITIVDRASGGRRELPTVAEVVFASFSAGGRIVLAEDVHGSELRTYDARTGKPGPTFGAAHDFDTSDDDAVIAVAIDRAACGATGAPDPFDCVKTFDLRSGAPLATLRPKDGSLRPDLSPDGRIVLLGREAFDARTGKRLWAAPETPDFQIFAKDGRSVWLGEGRRTKLVDVATGRTRGPSIEARLRWATFAPPEAAVVSDEQGLLAVTLDGATRRIAGSSEAAWVPFAIAPDSSWVAWSASTGAGITLVRASDGASLHRTLSTPSVVYTDDGLFDGPVEGLAELRVRDGSDLLRARLARAVEGETMFRRSGLLRDFLAGRPLAP